MGPDETAPASTSTHLDAPRSDVLGVPLPGVELALVPVDGRTEVRVRGPDVTPGYHRRPDLTAHAFDEEVYSAPATRWRSPTRTTRPRAWCSAAHRRGLQAGDRHLRACRDAAPAAAVGRAGAAHRRLICGHDGDCVGALVWLHPSHAHRCDADGVPDDALRAELVAEMQRLAADGVGSSQRVDRIVVLPNRRHWMPARSPTRAT